MDVVVKLHLDGIERSAQLNDEGILEVWVGIKTKSKESIDWEIIKAAAECFGVSTSKVKIKSGKRSSNKVLEVQT